MAERAHPEDIGFKDKFFGFAKNPYKKKLVERYKYCNQFIKDKDVIDIPTGTGWGTEYLVGYKSLIGMDISKESIEFAQQRYGNKKRSFIPGDMQKIPAIDSTADAILCLEGFEHVDRATGKKFIEEAKRVLKPGGLVILTCPVENEDGGTSGNPYHLVEYPEKELFEILNMNFRIVRAERFQMPDAPAYRFVLENLKN